MQNKLDMLFQHFWAIRGPNHTMVEYSLLSRCNHKYDLTIQWLIVSPGTQGLMVEVRSSLGDMMVFTKNSFEHKQMRQARFDSSSHDCCATSNLITSAGARKVTLMWGINIPWLMHFLYFSSSSGVQQWPLLISPDIPEEILEQTFFPVRVEIKGTSYFQGTRKLSS